MSQTHSWWVLSCLAILGRLHWIDRKKLSEFILASQDHETGGISDRPGDLPDPFHTLVCFCSVCMNTDFLKLNPRRYFQFGPILKKMNEIVEDCDFVNFFFFRMGQN